MLKESSKGTATLSEAPVAAAPPATVTARPVRASYPRGPVPAQFIEAARKKSWREHFRFGSRGSFLLLVALPTLLAAVYYFVIATPQYISEASFVVRSSNQQAISGLGAILRSTVMGGGGDPSYAVVDFIRSRDALGKVSHDVGLPAMLARPEADFLSRFPNPLSGDTQEDLFDQFQKIVSAVYDSSTGLTTLSVRAFRPGDSQAIATALLSHAEDLVNTMNGRAMQDAVALAQAQVDRVQQKSTDLQMKMVEYQVRENALDPQEGSKTTLQILLALTKDLTDTKAQIAQTQASSPQSPQLKPLLTRQRAIEQQIDAQKASVLGPDGHMARSVAEYQRLVLDSEFTEKELAAASASLEQARQDALRKQIYLERISNPSLADEARYPKRLLAILTVFAAVFIGYAIIWLFLANVREHAH